MIHLSAKTIYAPIAVAALLTASCTNDNEPMATDPNAIAFQTSVQTRAVTESFGQGDAFTIWGGYDNDATNVFDDETVTYDGTNWNYSGGTRYWVSGKTYDFYAVYPTGVGSCSANGTITVVDFDTSSNTDLMTAEATSMEGSNPKTVSFTFRHELARVQVVAQCEAGVTATLNSASLNNVSTQGTLTRTSAGATWDGLSSTTLTDSNNGQITDEYPLFEGDLLLIPQAPATLSVNITRSSGTPINETFNLADYTSGWVAGETYRYTILIEQDNIAITFSNFTADEWGETHTGGDINIGESTN